MFLCVYGLLTSTCLSTGKLGITPDDPRWIGAWWAGFLLCGALLFSSALLMFGFPQSLPTRAREEGLDSEQVMLPPSLSPDYETPKPSNGVQNHEPVNSPTCCQQLKGECERSSVVLQYSHARKIYVHSIVKYLSICCSDFFLSVCIRVKIWDCWNCCWKFFKCSGIQRSTRVKYSYIKSVF